jgi:hypothetical protein
MLVSQAFPRRGGCGSVENRSYSSRRAIASADAFGIGPLPTVASFRSGALGSVNGRIECPNSAANSGSRCIPSTSRATPSCISMVSTGDIKASRKVGLFGLIGLGLGFWQLDRMVKRVPLAEPWKAPCARRLDAKTLGAWFASAWNVPSATARKLIDMTMTTLFCVDPSEVSLLGSMVLASGGGSLEYYIDLHDNRDAPGGWWSAHACCSHKAWRRAASSSSVRRIEQTSSGVPL